MSPLAFLFASIALSVLGQFLMKSGMTQVGPLDGVAPGAVIRMFTNLRVLLGFVTYGLSSLLYLTAISKLDLSVAYPMLGLGYVAVVLVSWLFLREPVTALRWVGVALIISGVWLVGRGA